jgi:hypothetical protein
VAALSFCCQRICSVRWLTWALVRGQAWQGATDQVPYGIVASGLATAPAEAVACCHNWSWLTERHLGVASAPLSSGRGSIPPHSSSESCRVTLVTRPEADAAEAGSRTSSDSGFYRLEASFLASTFAS